MRKVFSVIKIAVALSALTAASIGVAMQFPHSYEGQVVHGTGSPTVFCAVFVVGALLFAAWKFLGSTAPSNEDTGPGWFARWREKRRQRKLAAAAVLAAALGDEVPDQPPSPRLLGKIALGIAACVVVAIVIAAITTGPAPHKSQATSDVPPPSTPIPIDPPSMAAMAARRTVASPQCVTAGRVNGLNAIEVSNMRYDRNGPRTETNDTLRAGDELCVLMRQGSWLNVEYQRYGLVHNGWVLGSFIRFLSPGDARYKG